MVSTFSTFSVSLRTMAFHRESKGTMQASRISPMFLDVTRCLDSQATSSPRRSIGRNGGRGGTGGGGGTVWVTLTVEMSNVGLLVGL